MENTDGGFSSKCNQSRHRFHPYETAASSSVKHLHDEDDQILVDPDVIEIETLKVNAQPTMWFKCQFCGLNNLSMPDLMSHLQVMHLTDDILLNDKEFSDLTLSNPEIPCVVIQPGTSLDTPNVGPLLDPLEMCADNFLSTSFPTSIPTSVIERAPKSCQLTSKCGKNSKDPWVCILCKCICEDSFTLWHHVTNKHHYCCVCCISFVDSEELSTHNDLHGAGHIMFYKCGHCSTEVRSLDILNNHTKLLHKFEELAYSRTVKAAFAVKIEEATKNSLCPYCGINGRKDGMLNHVRMHKVANCRECGAQFVTLMVGKWKTPEKCTVCQILPGIMIPRSPKMKLPDIKLNVLKPVRVTGSCLKDIPCLFCSDFSGTSVDIFIHTTDQHNVCRICIRSFGSKDEYLAHEDDHKMSKVKFYQCSHCLRHFEDLDEYKSHVVEKHKRMKAPSINLVIKTIPEMDMAKMAEDMQCPYCHFLLPQGTLLNHLKVSHKIEQCGVCSAKFVGVEQCHQCAPSSNQW
ncbi:hypothetical protein B566_EDAN012413 [Ephemera danica]|nr:hypothetical protein B566_EDAN012413 [Ephemera danica]